MKLHDGPPRRTQCNRVWKLGVVGTCKHAPLAATMQHVLGINRSRALGRLSDKSKRYIRLAGASICQWVLAGQRIG